MIPPLYITVFTDASYCHDTKAYGYAIWIKYGYGEVKRRWGGGTRAKNSNDAEMRAMERAIWCLIDEVPIAGRKVVLQSDSKWVTDVKGHSLLQSLRLMGATDAYYKWVKGHRGVKDARAAVNTWCDSMAKKEMTDRRKSILQQRKK